MLILVMMLLIGLCAGVWGFLMCFLPTQWDKLTGVMTFVGRRIESSPQRLHPLLRFGNRVAGLVILAVGCWFAYIASSEIYLVFIGRATTHNSSMSGTLPNTPTLWFTVLSILIIVIGIIMIVFPAKALAAFECVWPAGRSITPNAAPKAILSLRLVGIFVAVLALISLIH